MKRGVLILLGLVLITVVTVLIIVIARAQKPVSTDKVLKVWSPFDEEKTYAELNKSFLESNPGVTIDYKYVDAKDAKEYEAKVVNAIADGDGPDVWMVRNDWIPKHAPKSLPAVTASKNDDPIAIAKTRIEPALVDLNTFENKLYGIPMSADSLVLIYNLNFYDAVANSASEEGKQILGKTPATWADFANQTSVVTMRKGDTVQRSAVALGTVDNTYAASDILSAFLTQAEVTILSEDKKNVAFNLARFKTGQATFPATEALQFYTSFAHPGESTYSWNATYGDPVQAFLDGKTGALIGYYSTLQQILAKNPKFDIRLAPMVQKTASPDRVDYAATWSYIVNAETKQPTLSWNYLSYLSTELVQQTYAEKLNKLPASKLSSASTLDVSLKLPSEGATLCRVQFKTAKSLTKPEWQQVDEIFQDAIRQVVVLNKTAQNSADSAAERFKVFVPTQ